MYVLYVPKSVDNKATFEDVLLLIYYTFISNLRFWLKSKFLNAVIFRESKNVSHWSFGEY